MAPRSLQSRFLFAGCLLVLTAIASGVWSALTFAQLSAVADRALHDSQETIAEAAALAAALEREDDALLLALAGDADRARRELQAQRRNFDQVYAQLAGRVRGVPEQEALANLRQDADNYRAAGDVLLASLAQPGGRERYHDRVNPALRRAVADCGRLREIGFHILEQAGVRARDDAWRATGIVAAISLAALVLSTLAAIYLARGVIRLDELRSELVAVASHELKTPLTTLRMSLLMLAEQTENLSARQKELLAAAAQGAEELFGTIDELLDLTRIEAGQLRLQHEAVDLYGVIDQVLQSLQPRFQDAEITPRVERETRTAVVRGDAARLRSVLANLLTNALKYTAGRGEIVIRVAAAPNAETMLRFSVTDTGRGVPPEFHERVFEKFFRVEHHVDGLAEGTRGAGIGLYLCRQIVEAHGGTIRCEAGEKGRGIRIVVELPLAGKGAC